MTPATLPAADIALLADIGSTRCCSTADNLRLLRARLIRDASDGWVDLTTDAKLALVGAGYQLHPVVGWKTPPQVARLIEVGDVTEREQGAGAGVLPGREVLHVDRVLGLVRFRYTSGPLEGGEATDSACHSGFFQIVRTRRNAAAHARALQAVEAA